MQGLMIFSLSLGLFFCQAFLLGRNGRKRERVEEHNSDDEIMEFQCPRMATQLTTRNQPTQTQLLAYHLMIPALADFEEYPDLKVFSSLNDRMLEQYLRFILRIFCVLLWVCLPYMIVFKASFTMK